MSETENTPQQIHVRTLMGLTIPLALVAMLIQWSMDDSSAANAGASKASSVTATAGQRSDLKVVFDHRTRGAKKAQTQLVVYGDFASPFAATSGATIDRLLATFGEKISVSYRHFTHADNHTSQGVAHAAEAAAKMGKFETFRQLAYGRNDGLGYVDFAAWAGPLGLKDQAYRKAVDSAEVKAAVARDTAQALSLGLKLRPTFFLNGVQLPGTLPLASLTQLVEQELEAVADIGGLAALMKEAPFDLDGVDLGTKETKAEGEARFGSSRVQISDADPSWGKPDAKVTIVEFGDFLCPYCSRGAEALSKIKKKYGEDQVRVVFKNLPLRMHRYADAAARAVLAAGRQGKFWPMHRKLYSRQKDVKSGGVDAILGLALELGLDLEILMDDMTSVAVRQKVADDTAEAARMGVRFTPNYFINEEHIGGALPYNNFVQIIDKHLAK